MSANNCAIDFIALEHVYPGGFQALKDINLKIAKGDFVALIGQNGAGKTTLVKHLNGLLRPSKGKILLNGQDSAGQKVSALACKVGFVFQNPDHQIFNRTVAKEVAFGPANLGLNPAETAERVREALLAVSLAHLAEASPQALSRGQRQRLALASVLAMWTEIIVLDEPTTGQDYKESLQIMDLADSLNRRGHTILFITHDMSLVARYARRVIVLCQGRILLDGPAAEVFAQPDKLNQTFIQPPQITALASALGIRREILTPEALIEELKAAGGGLTNVCCS